MGTPNIAYYGMGLTDWLAFNTESLSDPDRRAIGNVAKLVPKATTHYYYDGEDPIAATFGQPFDPSIALWHLDPTASIACNCYAFKAASDKMDIEIGVNQSSQPVPFIMEAKCVDENAPSLDVGFVRDPSVRYAYNTSGHGGNNPNISQTTQDQYGRLAADITYNAYALTPRTIVYNSAANTAQGKYFAEYETTQALSAYIDADPDNRWAAYIRPEIYYGNNEERYHIRNYAPADGIYTINYKSAPCFDIYSERLIPPDTQLRDYIKNGHSDWRADKIFSPFLPLPAQDAATWFGTAGSQYNWDSILVIGFIRNNRRNVWRDGQNFIPNTSYKIYGEWFRCNFNKKYYSDVDYHWELLLWDTDQHTEIPLNTPISVIVNNDNIRIMTKLCIDDAKGKTKGQATEAAVKHEVAQIGLYFTDDPDLGQFGYLGSDGDGEGIYLPVFDGDIPTGEYYTGAAIKTAPNADYTSTDKYIPTGVNPETGDKGEFISTVHSGSVEGGAQYFVLTQSQADDIITYLNTTYSPADMEELTTDFKGSNPFDYIICFKYYPFDIPVLAGAGAELCIGPLDLGYKRRTLEHGYGLPAINYLDMGSYYIEPLYRDYRDYKETMLTLMLPWCGIMQLDPVLYMGHTLSVKYAIDFVTGTVTAYIYRDDLIMDTANGKIGVDIPLSAVANGSYQVAITNALYQIKEAETARMWAGLGVAGGLIGTAVSAVSGNLLGAAAGIAGTISAATKLGQISDKIDNLEYNMDHTQPKVGQISSASPLNACTEDRRVQLLIIRHKMLEGFDATAYGKSTGYACSMSGLLGEFKGFTKCSSIDLSGLNCTDAEKNMINNLVKQGVRL